MIILKHLTVERFRLLRELNLHFPQRGSILIQGPNESGKSALLESIYFALYGESLTPDRGKRSLDDLILYGATNSAVTLTFSVSATEFTVKRTLERGNGQQVALYIRRLGMPEEEPITRLDVVNERIIAELGYMGGEALRNSCLIEQKGLNRLETLSGVEREATIRKLLGLEKLTHLAEHFQVTAEDECALHNAAERLRLAEMQVHIPVLSKQLDEIEAALDAVKVCEDLEEICRQEADIAEQEQTLEQAQDQRLELTNRRTRAQQLKKADATLAELIAAYDEIAEARRMIPELEKQIAELEWREKEDLPLLEKRVSELGELTRSFGTLQRMSNDLLTAVETIKELERDLKQQDEVRGNLKGLDDQVAYARGRLQEAQQALQDLEERRRAGRPQLEARIQRMRTLADRIAALQQVEEENAYHLASREKAEENSTQLSRLQKKLRDTEYEQQQTEAEAQRLQQQIDTLDKTWRQLSIYRQLEEWCRLNELSHELSQTEQHLMLTRQHQAKLTQSVMDARASATKYMGILVVCSILLLFSLGIAVAEALQQAIIFAALAAFAFFLLIAGISSSYYNYSKARKEEKDSSKQEQESINLVGTIVASREAVVRKGGSHEALARVEHEIRTLGGTVPGSLEDAKRMLQQKSKHSENFSSIQQQLKGRREDANTVRNRINATVDAATAVHNEMMRLEELRKKEGWANIEENLRDGVATIERMHQEITLLAGQEGLPLPSIAARLQHSSPILSPLSVDDSGMAIPELGALVESTIKSTTHEIESLDGKLDLAANLAEQVKIHQDALDVLLARQHVIEERNARYQTSNPALQIERAHEQQAALRQALQSLQDSLRQRVRPLGVAFGQAAINNAEIGARKQLEELQITLGNRVMLQEQHARHTQNLKDRQESLPEYYKQLSKFSNTLGSWIVPLNPFTEALVALRHRCQQELQHVNEAGIVQDFEMLQNREGAANAKIELCHQEIEEVQARITMMLNRRNRPTPKNYTLKELITVWPLLEEYSDPTKDHSYLEDERNALDQELTSLEEQEMALSAELQAGSTPLDLEQMRSHLEQQERSYQTKKHGNLLVKAVNERLMQKMLPRTEYYTQQVLRLLTSGRYHDVHLTTEPEEHAISGGPLLVSVWDTAAGEYVSRSALSGGAADQLSLALRLAFAIATLPRELHATPGFVLLDEPLSSFDRGRAQALVDVVTGDIMSQHFEQILLISHSSAFDPAMFPYHVYMDNGLIVESNLPVVQNLPLPIIDGKEESAKQAMLQPALSHVQSE